MVSSGATMPARGPGLDGHVADRHAPFHRQLADGLAGVLDDVAGGAVDADPADDAQNQVFGGDAVREGAFGANLHGPRPGLEQALGRQDVLHLRGADTEGEGAEGAVGRGVAVAANDGLAGLGVALLRADDVDDALAGAVDVIERHAELSGRSC